MNAAESRRAGRTLRRSWWLTAPGCAPRTAAPPAHRAVRSGRSSCPDGDLERGMDSLSVQTSHVDTLDTRGPGRPPACWSRRPHRLGGRVRPVFGWRLPGWRRLALGFDLRDPLGQPGHRVVLLASSSARCPCHRGANLHRDQQSQSRAIPVRMNMVAIDVRSVCGGSGVSEPGASRVGRRRHAARAALAAGCRRGGSNTSLRAGLGRSASVRRRSGRSAARRSGCRPRAS